MSRCFNNSNRSVAKLNLLSVMYKIVDLTFWRARTVRTFVEIIHKMKVSLAHKYLCIVLILDVLRSTVVIAMSVSQ